jgi:two-component system sensor histidine kinase KdpD
LAASTSAASALADADAKATPHRRALLAEIQEANARLNRIVGNLLDVARLESGKVVPRLDWHDARDVVQTALRELQRELSAHPVKLDLPAEPLLVELDFSLIQHAIANLLINAATHTPPGTPVEVRAETAEDQVVLSVADRGPGVSPAVLPRIFDKFFRAPGAAAGGSGLGLTIAKGFVEAHRGVITAENRPGGGIIISLKLPRRDPASMPEYFHEPAHGKS